MGKTNDWQTPQYIINDLGPFDLDPCISDNQITKTATMGIMFPDGLSREWRGFVWLNPPYGRETGKWVRRLVCHGNGIALLYTRTDTPWMQDALRYASAIKFLAGRIRFVGGKGNAPAPSIFLAFGPIGRDRLMRSKIGGVTLAPKEPEGIE